MCFVYLRVQRSASLPSLGCAGREGKKAKIKKRKKKAHAPFQFIHTPLALLIIPTTTRITTTTTTTTTTTVDARARTLISSDLTFF